jgi:ABC-type polysaccharide/polyol phosphate export permease
VRRDLTARYKRSVFGVAWTMLNPLGMMIVLSIVFSQIFRMNIEDYPAFVLSGLIAWSFSTACHKFAGLGVCYSSLHSTFRIAISSIAQA